MPLKRVALEVAESCRRGRGDRRRNTLVFTGGRVTPKIPTWPASSRPCAGPAPSRGRAVVLGAGGTAQAALAALRERAWGEIEVLVRSLGRTDELRATADRMG